MHKTSAGEKRKALKTEALELARVLNACAKITYDEMCKEVE